MEALRKEIEDLAYDYWEFRREYNIPGTAEGDWLRAEKEIKDYYNPRRHIEQFVNITKEVTCRQPYFV